MLFKNPTTTTVPHRHGSHLNRVASKSLVALPNLPDNISQPPSIHSPTSSITGIVVVSPGLSTNFRSSSSVDISAQDSTTDPAIAEIRRLRRLPIFHPLIPSSSTANFAPPGTGRVYRPSLAQLDSKDIVQIINCFREHLGKSVDVVEKKQAEIIGMQNKIDYEVNRLMEFLQFREHGVPSTSQKVLIEGGTVSGKATHGSTGKKPVDTIVMQTSQISCMIDQCSTQVQQLSASLQQINDALPNEKRLPPLKTDLTN